MDDAMIETRLENIEQRLARVEQFLPTLATKEELRDAVALLATKEEFRAAIAPLTTKEELRAAIAPLASKEELREEGERSRRHMTMLIEHQNSKIELLAEHLLSSLQRPAKE